MRSYSSYRAGTHRSEVDMSSVIPNKRLVVAKCEKCGRVYWHFSDEEPFSEFERRLRDHLFFAHVRKGEMTPAEASDWRKWFKLTWYRVYNPSEINTTPEQFEMLHPEFISLPDYEQLKLLAKNYPPGFIRILKKSIK